MLTLKSRGIWQLFISVPSNRDDGKGKKVTDDVRLWYDKGFPDDIQIQPAWQPPNPCGHPSKDLYPLIFSLSQLDGSESNFSLFLGFVTKVAYKYTVLNKTTIQKHTHITAEMPRHLSNIALKTNKETLWCMWNPYLFCMFPYNLSVNINTLSDGNKLIFDVKH